MRDFYVYGFKSRTEYDQKSSRSYDDERRRIESWMGDYMGFRNTSEGKNIFISIDSRRINHNPLYKAFKAKSFTDGDITLHFIIFDILSDPSVSLTLKEIISEIEGYLSDFDEPFTFDESTVRKKLKEYCELGIIHSEKKGRTVCYSRMPDTDLSGLGDAISFFSEAGQLGVVGSTLLDKDTDDGDIFTYKHHYITDTFESEILYSIFDAMSEKRMIRISSVGRKKKRENEYDVIPLKIYVSSQTGRRYLAAKDTVRGDYLTLRLDYIHDVIPLDVTDSFDQEREEFDKVRDNMWGVSGKITGKRGLEHVRLTLHIGEGEEHIWERLEREKRNGTVNRTDDETAVFECDVYDSFEMIPWIRSFTCRITGLEMTNKEAENRIKRDLTEMYEMYGIGGDEDGIQ